MDQCREGDWHQLGVVDGAKGRGYSYFDKHVRTCRWARIVPDEPTWLAGHKVGARQFCKVENAYKYGKSGIGYYNICEPDQHALFAPLHKVGFRQFKLELRISYAEREIASVEYELKSLADKLEAGKIDSFEFSSSVVSLNSRTRDHVEDMAEASVELAKLEWRLKTEGLWKVAGLSEKDKPD
ncbi:MAG: DUF2799 domain-containing protein [Rhizobiaceae bacterium]